MTPSPLHRLTLLELRRVRPQLGRSVVLLVLIFGVLILTGRATSEIAVFILLGMALAFVMLLPPNQLRDKLDGSMSFLLTLPVDRSTLAMARCLATGLVMLPGALFPVAAWYLAAPTFFPAGLAQPGLAGVALASWSTMTALSILLSSLLVRFRLDQVSAIPFLVLLGLLFVLDPLLTPFLPHQARVAEFLSRPEAAILVETGLVVLSAGVAMAGYRMLRKGLERFQPMAGSLTW